MKTTIKEVLHAEGTLLSRVTSALHKSPLTLPRLAEVLHVTEKEVRNSIKELRAGGNLVRKLAGDRYELSSEPLPKKSLEISTKEYFGDNWIRCGVIADVHLASHYERLDVLNALYDVYASEGIKVVYLCGNWIDGEARFNQYDVKCIGIDNQINYFLTHFPQRPGIETHVLSGDDHEGWYVQKLHVNVGERMEDMARRAGRIDLHDLGYMERDLHFKQPKGSANIRVIHAGGGSAYAVSYTSQKYVESLQGGEKPNVVFVGHFHKFDWSYPREVSMLQAGTTQDQTPFLRKKRIQAMVGGCIFEAKQDTRGNLVRQRVEWMPFYDRQYYKYHWR